MKKYIINCKNCLNKIVYSDKLPENCDFSIDEENECQKCSKRAKCLKCGYKCKIYIFKE